MLHVHYITTKINSFFKNEGRQYRRKRDGGKKREKGRTKECPLSVTRTKMLGGRRTLNMDTEVFHTQDLLIF